MTYLINWEKVQDKVLDLEKDFIENEISHVIVNSSYDEKEHWMNIGGDSWATRQLYEIYKDAYLNNYDYIFLLYGDVSVNELPMSKVISNSIDYLKNNYGCGIYTTSFTYNHWGSPHTIIKNNENNVHNICATDFSFVGISREVYSFIFNFMDNFSVDNNIDEYHSAWGFDILCWIYCIYNNIDLLRDCNINLIHDISTTGYNDAIAREQMHHTVDSGINYMVNNLGLKESSIRTIRDMFNTQYHSRTFEYKDFYQWGAK
jgi:hypothetical protein